jgi:hypothetical protein
MVRFSHGQVRIGPDSVGSRLAQDGVYFGGQTFTVSSSKFTILLSMLTLMQSTDLILSNALTDKLVSSDVKLAGLLEIKRAVEAAIELVKTKPADARVILVGGGSIIVGDKIAGVEELVRPEHFEVANAVGAAVCYPRQQILCAAH